MKPGRNAPCPCGSGRKYKQCCLATEVAVPPARLRWHRLRQELDGLPARMFRFALDTYGEAALDEAWDAFVLGEEAFGPFDPETPHAQVFMPWLLHAWAPVAGDTDVADPALHGRRPTELWLARHGARLSPLLREYLVACLEAPFGFHEVEHCDPGQGFVLCDVFTGERHEVIERMGSQHVRPGDLLYAQPVTVQGLTVLEAIAAVALPPADKVGLIELRRRIAAATGRICREQVRDWECELRDEYLRSSERLLNPARPVLHNTDGEEVELHKLVFDIASAQAAFEALKSLDILADEAELLERAERDADGGLQRVELTWARHGNRMHAHWDNTVLGRVVIAGRRLTAEVNSRERAERFRQLVAERLGGQARLRLDEVQSAGRMLAQGAATTPAAPAPDRAADGIEALLARELERHYEAWPDTALPALAGRTPRQAIAEGPDGREQVEALLRDIGRHGPPPGVNADPFPRLRERLGLPARV